MTSENAPSGADRFARPLLFLLLGAFVVYGVVAVPRLTNENFGNVEFSGWSGPFATRLLRGERPYVDFILPIPPGSFVLLAGVERLLGRHLLLAELAVNGALQLGMGVLAYVTVRAVSTRKVALFTTLGTLATLLELRKECAYDHTAQLAAWGSVACGLWALRAADGARRERLFLGAGTLAGATLLFKQSTAVGAVLGWIAAFGYLLVIDVRSKDREAVRGDARALLRTTQGVALGVASTWLVVLLLGGTFGAFFRATFIDGAALKGGTPTLFRNLASYLLDYPSYRGSLFAIVLVTAVGARLAARGASFHLGDEPTRAAALRTWEVVALAVVGIGAFVGGALVLRYGPKRPPALWVPLADAMRDLPVLTLVPMLVVFAAHVVVPSNAAPSPETAARVRTGHVLNAALLVALCCTLFHNTSAPEFRPYYDNNALIPLTFACAFVVLDRAALGIGSVVFLALVVLGAGGERFARAMGARTVVHGGPASGLLVSDDGVGMLRMAQTVRALAKPSETVLVLPEDLELVQLIDRPRPPLLGAIVFVDQYPERLLSDDEARLREHPPRVIVLHPRNAEAWQDFFRIWSGSSAAEKLVRWTRDELMPGRYERVATFDTFFRWHTEQLDVYVRRDGSGATPP
ncbi:MAG TPA: hypothetical protein VHE30_10605 [Polyangiaceae bacterium]|nr:hypothetical protein [Polyangiaceae bacterium]